MKELLTYILEKLTGKKDIKIEEKKEGDNVYLEIFSDPENIGLIIGKNGNTIKAIQDVLRVRARLENVMVFVNVSEAK
ncbi:KH domain-containing protein [Patescibacteria group bacterium]|nr:KH domain-containing protein [Patescibacteria group bacterium]